MQSPWPLQAMDPMFVDEIPKTSVGKLDMKVLRERFKDWQPADAAVLADAAR